MKIIAGDSPLGEILEKAFASISDRDGAVIFVEHPVRNGFRQELHGLDDALTCAPSGIPIVMLAWQSLVALADDPRLHAALGYPNVVFRQLPEGLIEGIMVAFEEATEGKRTPDPLAIALLGAKITQQEIGILNHDLQSALSSSERMATWLERARKTLGDKKTQRELIQIVQQSQADQPEIGQFAGQSFPDVCVDVEGTLFDADLNFRPDILAKAEALAHGSPITIWTGGDMDAARKLVRKAEIPYKLIPKSIMRGATVRAVVDDLEESKFWSDYGVLYGTYHQA